MSKTVLIYSGGMDSTTLLYYLLAQGREVMCITFDYGQRHRVEIESARIICADNNLSHVVVDISDVSRLLSGSALTDNIEVPHGHYASDNMKLTVVPNRNAFMISIAYAYAISSGATSVSYAAHAGDHFIYPDCRPDFVHKVNAAFMSGSETTVRVDAPFLNMTKGEIAKLGASLGVPYDKTWTCYEGGDTPCGKCGSCDERREAMLYAGVTE